MPLSQQASCRTTSSTTFEVKKVPEVAWVGHTRDQAKAQGIKVNKGLFRWIVSGRAIAHGRDQTAV